jgi:MYXO-CTERM domain-containing protein
VAVGPSLLVGAPYASTVFALDDGLQVLGYTEGEGDLGHWVGWVDDMNGDTTADAVVVAPSASGELEQQGLALLISGRDAGSGAFPGAGGSVMDADNDGVLAGEDCDDSDPRLYPGAQEICRDDLDNDCDGATDEKDDCVRGGCSTAPANLTPGSAGAFWLLALAAILRRRRC